MFRAGLKTASLIAAVAALLIVGLTGVNFARAELRQKADKTLPDQGNYAIYDTPQATLLLDRESGQLWRIGYTEVGGQRYWFGTYVPKEPPTSFSDFQQRVRKAIRGAPSR